MIVVHHKGAFELNREDIRERQAVATARFVEELLHGRDDLPVVLVGDFNAGPDAANIRFLTGRQSLDGLAVRYEDAWEAVHGTAPGLTFDPRNALVRAGQMPLERGRRIDRILTRSGPYGPLLDVADCRIVLTEPVNGTWPSDHFGLVADLRRPPHPPGEWKSAGHQARYMDISSVTIGFRASDLAAAMTWYQGAFGGGEPEPEPTEGIAEFRVGPVRVQLCQGATERPLLVRFVTSPTGRCPASRSIRSSIRPGGCPWPR